MLLTDQAVVVLLTRRTYSYLLAVDRRTGDTVWKTDREPGVAWSTPVLAPGGGEIVVSASGRVEGFDAETGGLRWWFTGFRGNHVPSPTVTGDLVIVGGMAVEANLALRRGRTGALDRADVAWTAGSGSNFASPFAYRGCVYWVNPAGAARCLAPDSGAVRWTHRLPASTWATPLGHDDRVYFFTEQGVTQVLRASTDAPEVLAANHLSVDAPVTRLRGGRRRHRYPGGDRGDPGGAVRGLNRARTKQNTLEATPAREGRRMPSPHPGGPFERRRARPSRELASWHAPESARSHPMHAVYRSRPGSGPPRSRPPHRRFWS